MAEQLVVGKVISSEYRLFVGAWKYLESKSTSSVEPFLIYEITTLGGLPAFKYYLTPTFGLGM